jgi:hypothetical protein
MNDLPYDPAEPPHRPPAGCVNNLMWQLAWRVFTDHRPALDGWCAACRPYRFFPCPCRKLGRIGLAAACGRWTDRRGRAASTDAADDRRASS